MKGRIGTSTGLLTNKTTWRTFVRKSRAAQAKRRGSGKSALQRSKTPVGIIVVPPTRS